MRSHFSILLIPLPQSNFGIASLLWLLGRGGGGGGEQNVVDKSVKRLKDIQLTRIEDNI